MFAALSGFALADSITGTVTNKTTNKPAAGDDVVLIRLQQGMQEAAHTKTDAKGQFHAGCSGRRGCIWCG